MALDLFDKFLQETKAGHRAFSSAWFTNLGQQMSLAAHTYKGWQYGQERPETIAESTARLTGGIGRIRDAKVDTNMFRSFLSNALAETGKNVGKWQSRIMRGDIPDELSDPHVAFRMAQSLKATKQVSRKTPFGKTVSETVNYYKIEPHDILSAARLSQEGTTLGDVVDEYSKGLQYPSHMLASRASIYGDDVFRDVKNETMQAGLEAGYAWDPTQDYFPNFLVKRMNDAKNTYMRNRTGVVDSYGGVATDLREKSINEVLDVMQTGFAGVFGNEHYASLVSEQIRWMEEDPRRYRASGWVDAGMEGLGTPRPMGVDAVWDVMERYAKQYGSVPVSGMELTGRTPNDLKAKSARGRSLTPEQVAQVRSQYESANKETQAKIMSSLRYSVEALTASGPVKGQDYLPNDERFEREYLLTQQHEGVYVSDTDPDYISRQSLSQRPNRYAYSAVDGKPYLRYPSELYEDAPQDVNEDMHGEHIAVDDDTRYNFKVPSERQMAYMVRDQGQRMYANATLRDAVEEAAYSARPQLSRRLAAEHNYGKTTRLLATAGFYVGKMGDEYYERLGLSKSNRLEANRAKIESSIEYALRDDTSAVAHPRALNDPARRQGGFSLGNSFRFDTPQMEIPFHSVDANRELVSTTVNSLRRELVESKESVDSAGALYKHIPYESVGDIIASDKSKMVFGLPGSGKTQMFIGIASRLAEQRAQNRDSVDPAKFKYIAYTKANVAGYKERIRGDDLPWGTDQFSNASTLNSVALGGLLRSRGKYISEEFNVGSVVGTANVDKIIGDVLQTSNNPYYHRYNQTDVYKEGYAAKVVKPIRRVIEQMAEEGITPQDLKDNVEIRNRYLDEHNMDPDMLAYVSGAVRGQLNAKNQIMVADQIPMLNRILKERPDAAKYLFGDRYDQINVDELNQMGTASRELLGHILGANPNAVKTIAADPIQAGAWRWLGGGHNELVDFAEKIGMPIVGVNENYRLSAGTQFLIGDLNEIPDQYLSASSELSSNKNIRAEQRRIKIQKALDLHIGQSPDDTVNAMARNIKGAIDDSVSPSDIMAQARTNVDRRRIFDALERQGVPVAMRPSEDDYADQVQRNEMTPDDVSRILSQWEQPDNTVVVGTIHSLQGTEKAQNYGYVSDQDFKYRNRQQQEEAASTASIFYSRTSGDNPTHVFSAAQRGGLPKHLRGYDVPVEATAAYKDAQNIQGRRVVARPTEESVQRGSTENQRELQYPKMWETAPTGVNLPEGYESALRAVAGQSARQASAMANAGEIGTTESIVHAKASELLMEGVMKIAEEAKSKLGEGPQFNQLATDLGRATYNMSSQVAARLRLPGFSGAGGGGGDYTGWGEPSMMMPGDPGYDPAFGAPTGGRAGGFADQLTKGVYRLGRASWMLSSGAQSIGRAYTRQATGAKQYGNYLSYFAPFATLGGGELQYSEQGYGVAQQKAALAMQRGQYEQFGGFTEWAAGLAGTGQDWMPRAASAGQWALGTGKGIVQGSLGLMMAGRALAGTSLASIGSGLATAGVVGLGIAGGLAVGTGLAVAGMEIYNANFLEEGEKKKGFGMIPTAGPYAKALSKYEAQAAREMGVSYNPVYSSPPQAVKDRALELMQQNEPALYYSRWDREDNLASNVQDFAMRAADITGGNISGIAQDTLEMYHSMPESMSLADLTSEGGLAEQIAGQGASLGISSGYYSTLAGVASNLGYSPNTEDYFNYISGVANQDMTPTKLNELVKYSSRVAQFGGQLGGYFSSSSTGNRIVANMNPSNITQGYVSQMASTASLLERFGAPEAERTLYTSMMSGVMPAQGNAILGIASQYAARGGSPSRAISGLLAQDYSLQDLNLAGKIAGGDLGALSYASRTDALGGIYSDPGNQYLNYLGEPIGTRSGMDFIGFAQSHGMGPVNPVTNGMAGIFKPGVGMNALTPAQWFQGYLGHSNMPEGYYQAWAEGGATGGQNFVQSRLAELSMASAGVAMQRLNATRAYYWGEGGSWDQPTSGSMWGLEDTMREMQYQSTLGTWEYQEKRSQAQWGYQQQSNAFTQERMDLTRGYQDTAQSMNRTMDMKRRMWAQEDWGYQDQMSSLSYEWGMEDINEAIRSATGRDRRTLLTRRDRMTTKYNLEQEQTDTQRSRQEEIWGMEDERFDEQKQYQEELMELEQRRFDASVEHQQEMHDMETDDFDRRKDEYEEQRAVEEEMRQLQREHQADMMDLQEQSIGIQAESARLQAQSAEDQKLFLDDMRDQLGLVKEDWEYGGREAFNKIDEMLGSAGDLDTSTLSQLESVFGILSGANIESNSSAVADFIDALNSVNLAKLGALTGKLREWE